MSLGRFQIGNLSASKFVANESLFDKLDEEKATMLGLLMADGCVAPCGGYPQLRLTLIDPEPVYRLRRMLKSHHKISCWMPYKKGCICQPAYSIQIGGLRHLGPRLQYFGMTHPKPTRFPQNIPPKLYHHLIRGYFEGDGCVYWDRTYKKLASTISGHLPMLDWIGRILESQGIMGPCSPNSGCFRLSFGKSASIKLYHYLYDDAIIILIKRKKMRFEELLRRSE